MKVWAKARGYEDPMIIAFPGHLSLSHSPKTHSLPPKSSFIIINSHVFQQPSEQPSSSAIPRTYPTRLGLNDYVGFSNVDFIDVFVNLLSSAGFYSKIKRCFLLVIDFAWKILIIWKNVIFTANLLHSFLLAIINPPWFSFGSESAHRSTFSRNKLLYCSNKVETRFRDQAIMFFYYIFCNWMDMFWFGAFYATRTHACIY